ncbi:glycosyltransferase [Leucobacter soli]|uniref:glycosyltransferase n=1 Tax=Leucobacter soli TaxID=2812850 RepID=UPI003617D602
MARQLADGGAERIVTAPGALPFGEAVKRAAAAMPALASQQAGGSASGTADDAAVGSSVPAAVDTAVDAAPAVQEWLWLLTEDSAPEPDALERILETVQRAPSVVLAGPKLVDWDRPERIIELGQSLTTRGDRWLLRRQELDQQQYDHLQDVLGVGPVGLLVRRDIWERLNGFDPALPVFDDGLDLSVRARLAGYRVVVAPASRIRFARSGVAGPRIDRSRAVMRTAHRQGRTAHLHRRIAYAPAFFAFFMWLGLPLVAVARVLWALIREQPGQMLGEFAAALRVFFTPGSIVSSRRRIAAADTAGWSAVRPLRVDPKTVRTTRMIDREALLAAQGRQTRELHFVSTGGLATLVAAIVVAVALTWWAIPRTGLSGGALAPLSPSASCGGTLTQSGVPADPFAWVLALLGTLTFWNPSHAVVLLLIVAIPLATLGGWIWGAQLTESKAGRALIGLGWALSPVLLGSLGAGRLPTVILAVVLPWLLLAASRCRESWSWAGSASLLAAVALACAPVLIPAAAVVFVVGLVSSLRGITRVLTTAIAPLALFAPKLVALIGGRALDLVIDPGLTPVFRPGTVWHSMLGFPEFGLAGWAPILDAIGLGDAPATLLVGVLLLPIVLLAALGLFTGRVFVTVTSALIGGLGLLTALASAQLRLVGEGPEAVAVWTGSGLSSTGSAC